MPSHEQQQNCARELLHLIAWIWGITVALILHYGCYGDKQMALGPNSSRMLKASSVFVEEVLVKDEKNKGLLLYGFVKPPELSVDSNWTLSKHLYADSYCRQGISLWLNEGSRIWMKWEVVHGSGSYEDMLVVLLKGKQKLKEFQRFYSMSNLSDGNREAKYIIDEDNIYHIDILNQSPWSMVVKFTINISSKMYDTSEATSICSTSNGLCKLKLSFPFTQYFVLTTPNSDVSTTCRQVQFSFVARLAAYFLVIGCLVVVIYLILHYLGACGDYQAGMTTESENEPMVPVKETPRTYRTNEEDPATSSSSYSDEELHKICAICYDEMRNCFFTPCGHSISCYTCTQRIVKEMNICPVCRRRIHKVRRLMVS